jgi:hypothetical protein
MSAAPADQFAVAETQALEDARTRLSSNDDTRADLQREVMGAELKLALKDLREGVRGMIRVSPLTSVFAAALIGMVMARRRRRRDVRR